jgi:hypothetical protein
MKYIDAAVERLKTKQSVVESDLSLLERVLTAEPDHSTAYIFALDLILVGIDTVSPHLLLSVHGTVGSVQVSPNITVLTTVLMKCTVFWVVTPYNWERIRCFGGIYYFHLQSLKSKPEMQGNSILCAFLAYFSTLKM